MDHLTPREVEVLLQVAEGLSNRQIAERLGLSSDTVAYHLRDMLRRMRARSRTDLAARAYAQGMLSTSTWPPMWSGRRCVRPIKSSE